MATDRAPRREWYLKYSVHKGIPEIEAQQRLLVRKNGLLLACPDKQALDANPQDD